MTVFRDTNFQDLSWRSQVRQLRRVAANVLPLYDLEDASFRLLKYHDNGVFRLDGDAQTALPSTPPAAEDWDLICKANQVQAGTLSSDEEHARLTAQSRPADPQ